MVDLNQYRSHPEKKLVDHIRGVLTGVQKRTSLKIAEIAAIFHDIGKLNPNFQKKLEPGAVTKYSNHAYLSAFAFLCYLEKNLQRELKSFNNQLEWTAAILTAIAHHHGNIPDFPKILKEDECQWLINFLVEQPEIPASELLSQFMPHSSFSISVQSDPSYFYSGTQYRLSKSISAPLQFYQETQFAFASLIAADKADAGGHGADKQAIERFCEGFDEDLSNHLAGLKQDTPLNQLRTQMRGKALESLKECLERDPERRIFSLTAPTGSGKTLMLLSLGGEIIKQKGPFRLIYSLPFLSITEQVEEECQKIFRDFEKYVQRIDSKSENKRLSSLMEKTDEDPSKYKDLLFEQFRSDTFDYPFIITTFVRFFETLLSNKNATLLKLPNFSRAIFFIDEIQALPPRLYGFFVAILDSFCARFDSYAILSTATMPNFDLPQNSIHDLPAFFPGYSLPPELLPLKYFEDAFFNRYRVEGQSEIGLEDLANQIGKEESSALVILNTIQDSKDLFQILCGENPSEEVEGDSSLSIGYYSEKEAPVLLLNTHFTPHDRKIKIDYCKKRLGENRPVLLISTQLIEAGVDIDFPVVYRDIAPLPSIVQSAGRCNRNNQLPQKGRVVVFYLQRDEKLRASCIYRGQDKKFLNFAKEKFHSSTHQERELLEIQQKFFKEEIREKTLFGYHQSSVFENKEIYFVERIRKAAFEEIGKFRLIDEEFYGEEHRYYVPEDEKDGEFEILEDLYGELKEIDFKDFEKRKPHWIKIESHLKRMAHRIVQIHFSKDSAVPPKTSGEPCCGIEKLQLDSYSSIKGINLTSENQFI